MSRALPVYERFHAWQGEGAHMGKSAFFIRLHGCPVHCPWCDSAGTWHPDHVPDSIDRIEPEDLAEEAIQSGSEIVVITGGEPAIHPLYELVHELRIRSIPIHIETCGAFPVQGEMDWITLSPKWNKLPIEETFLLADEFKIIVETPEDLTKWTEALPMKDRRVPVWLHPEWSKAEDEEVLGAINQWIKDHGFPYRAGYQLHKLYKVDEADERSRPIASLSHLPSSDKLKE